MLRIDTVIDVGQVPDLPDRSRLNHPSIGQLHQANERLYQANERWKNEILDANKEWKEEIKHHFEFVAENLLHDFRGAKQDKIEQHEDRIARLERHAGLRSA